MKSENQVLNGEENQNNKVFETKKSGGSFPGLITREKAPMNLEFPFPTLDDFIVPTNRFYVRNHFPIPEIDINSWKLTVDGAVENSVSINYEELRKLPNKTISATLECAGNSRANLLPKPKGVFWEQGAVCNAEWTGVPLSVLLDKAGIKDDTVEIILEGADSGEVKDEPKSPGTISFARSLPLEKARQSEVLIAYQMNGEDLSPEHGFPARAVVPGWYGMASIKWLTRITATTTPFDGFWQTLDYAYWEMKQGFPTLVPITEMQVKAQIARPTFHEVVKSGTQYRLFGAAWSGESEISRVDVSCDDGKTWNEAKFFGDSAPYSWKLWEYIWSVPQTAGRYKLMAKAIDEKGNIQPLSHDPNRRNYMINFSSPIEILVQ